VASSSGHWRGTGGLLAAAGLLSLLFALGCLRKGRDLPRPEDVPVPERLEAMEPPVKAQFSERRAAVLRLLSEPDAPAEAVAASLGELGMTFHAYGDAAQAEACYLRALALAPRSFRWAYGLGMVQAERGDAVAAETSFRRASSLDPTSVPVRLRLAQLAEEAGRREQAEPLYREALARDPDCIRALVGLGRLALGAGRPAEAVELLQRALAWQPNAPEIHQALGMAYRELGERELARKHLGRVPPSKLEQQKLPMTDPFAAELDRRRTGARGHDMRAIRALDEGRYDLAAIEMRQALLADPDRAYARHGLAVALFRAGRNQEAVDALEELLRKDPTHLPSRLLLARVLAAQGNLRAAEERLEATLREWPDDSETHLQLAELRLRERRWESALEHYTRVLARRPDQSDARVGAGLSLIGLGQRRGALKMLLGDAARETLDPRVALLSARLLAAAPEPDLRDGPRALDLARRAFQDEPTISAAESIAMAEAEAGRFREALAWQREAASATGTPRPWTTARLARYQRAQPCREPWAPGEQLDRGRVLPPDEETPR
jgi:tetratricopeptide (TPR) repeat protein